VALAGHLQQLVIFKVLISSTDTEDHWTFHNNSWSIAQELSSTLAALEAG
jgi:hypothetical protein